MLEFPEGGVPPFEVQQRKSTVKTRIEAMEFDRESTRIYKATVAPIDSMKDADEIQDVMRQVEIKMLYRAVDKCKLLIDKKGLPAPLAEAIDSPADGEFWISQDLNAIREFNLSF